MLGTCLCCPLFLHIRSGRRTLLATENTKRFFHALTWDAGTRTMALMVNARTNTVELPEGTEAACQELGGLFFDGRSERTFGEFVLVPKALPVAALQLGRRCGTSRRRGRVSTLGHMRAAR